MNSPLSWDVPLHTVQDAISDSVMGSSPFGEDGRVSNTAARLKNIRRCAQVWSTLERTIFTSATPLLLRLCSHLDPCSLVRLGRTNSRLSAGVTLYQHSAWDVGKLLGTFIERSRISEFRMLLDAFDSLVFGPAVLRFFDRSTGEQDTLDIAVTRLSAMRFARFLVEGGYTPPGGAWGRLFPTPVGGPAVADFLNGDTVNPEASQQAVVYVFTRQTIGDDLPGRILQVALHVVRCQPYQHVLAQHSSK